MSNPKRNNTQAEFDYIKNMHFGLLAVAAKNLYKAKQKHRKAIAEDIVMSAWEVFFLKKKSNQFYQNAWENRESPDEEIRKENQVLIKKIMHLIIRYKCSEWNRKKHLITIDEDLSELISNKPGALNDFCEEPFYESYEREYELSLLILGLYLSGKGVSKRDQDLLIFHVKCQFKGLEEETILEEWEKQSGKRLKWDSYMKNLKRLRNRISEKGFKREEYLRIMRRGVLVTLNFWF